MSSDPVLHFHGAAGTVTGSCFQLETDGVRILVDCGMFQGSKTEKELNYRPFPFDPRSVDALVLTHAHIDHSGLVPKLVKDGFSGPIYATGPTVDLAAVMLPDSGHIQEMEVEHLNRRNRTRGREGVEPIYTAADATACMTQFRAVPLKEWQAIGNGGLKFRFWNAGHLLGSASIEVETGAGRRILFSGDIGPANKLLQHDPEAPSGWDYVLCESTYGDRDRDDATDEARLSMLRAEVRAATRPDGALVIPSFAVERTQELLADLVLLMERREIETCPILIDSPLASRASRVFQHHAREMDNGDLLSRAMRARNVRFTETTEQSKAIDFMHGFHIVIAASGMCEAGRIRHRLKNWLWREEGTVLLVGFQAAGTLGRILEDGAHTVRIQGEEIAVRARIRKLDVYSGHADGPDLARWVKARLPVKAGLFLVHGEDEAVVGMKGRLAPLVGENRLFTPALDSAYRLEAAGPVLLEADETKPRIDPVAAGHPDWHNDTQAFLLDLNDALARAGDAKARRVLLRRLKRALEDERHH
ncbi:MBL fold metallo-hydrolase [Gellertiella hungarica]|uniref:Metallo-beta-lactamase family protein n=1 Tax=Gellertiella hungarica TaxID=1572859 RepID=A0A7W6J8C4_9HYPH|nr:MBL fold metallo-hydrolase [Gellertiella hungarica]MBB4066612.1 metallo-beta-lactamase family protein [Gellertiella hungarica]